MRRLTNILARLDISKHIVCHLVGPHHTPVHHRTMGIIVIMTGVMITKISVLMGHVTEIPCDAVGWSLHAVGFIPFARGVEEKAEKAKSLTESVGSRNDQQNDENSTIEE